MTAGVLILAAFGWGAAAFADAALAVQAALFAPVWFLAPGLRVDLSFVPGVVVISSLAAIGIAAGRQHFLRLAPINGVWPN